MDIGVVTNPNSKKNQSKVAREDHLRDIVKNRGLIRQTAELEALMPVLEEFYRQNLRYWVADGGDGTMHWLINGALQLVEANKERKFPLFVPTNGGTIDFVARKAGIRSHAEEILEFLVRQTKTGRPIPTIQMDTLEVTGRSPGDPPGTMPFRKLGFAFTTGGIGRNFFEKYYKEKYQNKLAILRIILKCVASRVLDITAGQYLPFIPEKYLAFSRTMMRATPARVTVDGRLLPDHQFMGLHAGAIDLDFKVVKLFSHAAEPGKMHVAVGDMSPNAIAYKWVYIVFNKTVSGGTWHEHPAEELIVDATEELLSPVIDGEIYSGFEKLCVRMGPKIEVPKLNI